MKTMSAAAQRTLKRLALGLSDEGSKFLDAADRDAQKLGQLLDSYGLPDLIDDRKRTLLIRAAEHGNNEAVRFLIGAGASLNDVQEDHHTALYEAAKHGHGACVKLLLDAGADWSVEDYGRYGALAVAIREGHAEIVSMLLNAGVPMRVDPPNDQEWGRCALLTAARHVQPQCLRLLIEHGADAGAAISDGYVDGGTSVLHTLCASYGERFDAHGLECAKILLAGPHDLELRGWLPGMGRSGYTPLLICASQGHMEMAKLLIEAGADELARDDQGLDMFEIASDRDWVQEIRAWSQARKERVELDAQAAAGSLHFRSARI